MKRPKIFYSSLPSINGYSWSGFWDKLHHFVKKEATGYFEIRCTDEDITSGNLIDMINYGVTR